MATRSDQLTTILTTLEDPKWDRLTQPFPPGELYNGFKVVWGQLLTVLDDWPDDEGLAGAVDAASAALEGSTAHLRLAPEMWWRGVIKRKGGDSLRVKRRGEKGHPALALVRSLELYDKRITDKAARLLAACPQLAGVARLGVSNNRLTAAGLEALLEAEWPLMTLSVSRNKLGDDGARAIAAATHLSGLTELSAGDIGMGPAGAAALLAAPQLARLQTLVLIDNPMGDAGAIALAEATHLTRLWQLNLWGCQIGDEGAAALGDAPHLINTRHIDLRDNLISDEGAVALATSPLLQSGIGRALTLTGNLIGDAGAAALFEVLSGTSCRLNDNKLGDGAVDAFLRSERLAHYTQLELNGNVDISDAARDRLHEALLALHGGKLQRAGYTSWHVQQA